jgi:hypothetical protein
MSEYVSLQNLFIKIILITFAAVVAKDAPGQSPPNLPQLTSLCEVANHREKFEGHEILVRGHFFRGHHGAAVSIYCGSSLTMLPVWGNFDSPKGSDHTHWFLFHRRIEQKSGLGFDGKQTGLVLVVNKVSPAN